MERKYVVFATPVSEKRRCQPSSFILDSLSAQMNVPDTKFSRNTMKLLNHNASTLRIEPLNRSRPRDVGKDWGAGDVLLWVSVPMISSWL